MKIEVFSEEMIQTFKTDEEHIVISVRSPQSTSVLLPLQKSRIDTLFLEFHDVDESCVNINSEYFQFFNSNQAEEILNFINIYKDRVNLIAVNCEAGISRSAGISAALAIILNGIGSDAYYFKNYIPNMYVYRKILETHFKICYVCNEIIDNNSQYLTLLKDPKTGKRMYRHKKCKPKGPLKSLKRK